MDPMLMRGDGWIRCCICGELHVRPFAGLALDRDGVRWDVCRGECAVAAGVIEADPPGSVDGSP